LRPIDNVNFSSKKEKNVAYIFLGLIFLFVFLFSIYPFVELFIWSFTNKHGSVGNYVGIDNYKKIFASEDYYNVIIQTLIFSFSSVFFKLIIGCSLALLSAQKYEYKNNLKLRVLISMYIIPWAIPTVASMFIWSFIYFDQGGVINYMLKGFGIISNNIAWLGERKIATFSLVTVNIWRGVGFFYASILAARILIPIEYYYIGFIEYVSNWTIFWKITFPNIKKIIFISVLISFINTFTDFQIVHILTDGGPANSTQVFSTMIYEYAFKGRGNLGYAAAFEFSMLPLLLFISILLMIFAFRNKKALYE
jgi:multiple sugar transport system permease protein